MSSHHIVFFIHGIKTGDGGVKAFSKLKNYLYDNDIDSHLVDYGKILLPGDNTRAIEALIEAITPYQSTDTQITVVGFSNGAWASVQVAEMGYRIDNLVLISAALNRSHAFPECVKEILVYYGESDWVLKLANLKAKISTLLNNPEVSGWGDMGRVGYQGDDIRVTNYKLPAMAKHKWHLHDEIVILIGTSIIQILA